MQLQKTPHPRGPWALMGDLYDETSSLNADAMCRAGLRADLCGAAHEKRWYLC